MLVLTAQLVSLVELIASGAEEAAFALGGIGAASLLFSRRRMRNALNAEQARSLSLAFSVAVTNRSVLELNRQQWLRGNQPLPAVRPIGASRLRRDLAIVRPSFWRRQSPLEKTLRAGETFDAHLQFYRARFEILSSAPMHPVACRQYYDGLLNTARSVETSWRQFARGLAG